mmetsp:Transcript_53048/g.169889  ORF Transcript_53048/g.169889 Transcript_53048/m.169889 type:complete len:323 (+) Transcript_53048:111-1079(+)
MQCSSIAEKKTPLRLRAYQSAQADRDKHVMMVWTPRAASSSAMEIWALHLGEYAQAITWTGIHQWRMHVLDKERNGGVALPDDFTDPNLFKFKIVMNPFHFAVTMFQNAMKFDMYARKRMRIDELVPAGIERRFAHRQKNMTFLQFLRLQRGAEDFVRKCGVAAHHLSMQTAVENGQVWKPNYICRIEELETCLAAVSAATNEEWKLPPRNSSVASWHNTARADAQGETATKGYMTFGSVKPEPEDFYKGESGNEAAELVRELYAPDFSYGYDSARPDDFSAFAMSDIEKQSFRTQLLPTPEEEAASAAANDIWPEVVEQTG